MVLRDIFTELGEIFSFNYEKNQNGSYRVNTIIANIVYPGLYNNKEYTENDICYFLKNTDYTYQHYPNIRNSFSELMNPKDNSKRFPVVEFADLMEIDSMYSYYKDLIQNLTNNNVLRLEAFIEKIMTSEIMLHSKLKLVCIENYEFITWIIIFSMFNKTIAEEKFKKHSEAIKNSVDYYSTDELYNHNLSISVQKSAKLSNMATALLITSVCIQIVLVFAPQFIKEINNYNYYFFILLFSFITLGIWFLQAFLTYKRTYLKTLFHFVNSYSDFKEIDTKSNFKLKPHNSVIESKRSRFRKIFFPICITSCVLALIPAIIVKSFPLFGGLIFIIILIYLCADRIVSSYLYKTFYDSLTTHNKTNPYRGMAKIYKWEYEKTGLNFKDKYYKNNIPLHSNECYQNIFYLTYDRNKWGLIDIYLVVFFIYAFFLMITSLSKIIGNKYDFFKLPNNIDINLLIYLVTIGVFCIITALCNKGYFTGASYALHSLSRIQNNPADAAKLYMTMQSENFLKEVDVARGIYVYNISRFEQGAFIEDIFPESDRMLYYHQAITYREALKITYWFIYAISIFIFVWHMENYMLFFPITILILLIYIISRLFFIDRIHYLRLLREIKKLSSSEKQ